MIEACKRLEQNFCGSLIFLSIDKFCILCACFIIKHTCYVNSITITELPYCSWNGPAIASQFYLMHYPSSFIQGWAQVKLTSFEGDFVCQVWQSGGKFFILRSSVQKGFTCLWKPIGQALSVFYSTSASCSVTAALQSICTIKFLLDFQTVMTRFLHFHRRFSSVLQPWNMSAILMFFLMEYLQMIIF